jgi:hypothetical protein
MVVVPATASAQAAIAGSVKNVHGDLMAGVQVEASSPSLIVCNLAFISVKTAYLTAVWTSGPATTLPLPRISATGRSPSVAARER